MTAGGFGSGRVAAASPVRAGVVPPPGGGPQGPSAAVGPAAAPPGGGVDAPVVPPPGDGADPAAGGLAAVVTPTVILVAALAVVALVVVVRRGWWRTGGLPTPARTFDARWSLLFALGLMLGTPVLATIVHAALTAVAGSRLPDPGTLAGGLVLGLPVYALMAAAVLAWWSGGRPGAGGTPGAPGPPPAGPGRAAGAGLLGLLLTWPMVVTVTAAVAAIAVLAGAEPPAGIAPRTPARIVEDPAAPAAIATIVMVVVLVPWLEEAIYRGMLQGGLVAAGLGRWPALLLASAIFAVKHLGIAEPHAVAGLFVLGLGLGLAMERTGRVLAPVAMHAAFNAGNVAFAVLAGGGTAAGG